MVRFEKTRIHPVSAALFLIGLYALAGFAYAAVMRSADSMKIWAIVAALALIASTGYQHYVTKKQRRAR